MLDVEKFLKALATENVEYILVGGMAAIGHGMNYATDDLDICYRRNAENLTALVRALTPAHPTLRVFKGDAVPFLFDAKTLKSGLNFTLVTDWGSIDLLGELEKVGHYETLISKTIQLEFFGIPVNTLSLDDLIRAKKAAGRTKDKLHLLELEAIREIRN